MYFNKFLYLTILFINYHTNFDNILINEKSYENILASYKTLMGDKPMRIRFDKVNGFTTAYNETRYLVLFGPEKYDAIYNRIRYLR